MDLTYLNSDSTHFDSIYRGIKILHKYQQKRGQKNIRDMRDIQQIKLCSVD